MMSAGLDRRPGLGYAKDRFAEEHLIATTPPLTRTTRQQCQANSSSSRQVNGLDGNKLSEAQACRRETPEQKTRRRASM